MANIDYHLTAYENFKAGNLVIPMMANIRFASNARPIWLPHRYTYGINDAPLPVYVVHTKVYEILAKDHHLDMTGAEYELWGNARLGPGEFMPYRMNHIANFHVVNIWEQPTETVMHDLLLNDEQDNIGIWKAFPEHSLRALWFGQFISRVLDREDVTQALYINPNVRMVIGQLMAMLSELVFGAPDMETIFNLYADLVDCIRNHDGRRVEADDLIDMVREAWKYQNSTVHKMTYQDIWHFPFSEDHSEEWMSSND